MTLHQLPPLLILDGRVSLFPVRLIRLSFLLLVPIFLVGLA